MAKKSMMSAKAKTMLKVTTIIWIVMVGLLLGKLGSGHTTRTIPDFEKVTVTVPLPEGDTDPTFSARRSAFIGAEYLTTETISFGSDSIKAGTTLGSREVKALVKTGYRTPLTLLDPAGLIGLSHDHISVTEDIFSKTIEKTDETKPMIPKGKLLNMENLMLLAQNGWVGEAVPVKGEDKIVGINLTMLFVMINFLFLVGILYGLLWEPILGVLDERAEKIRTDLETAKSSRTDAEQYKTGYESQLAKINQERAALLEQGKKEGSAERERIVTEARNEAEAVLASAKAETDASSARARKELLAQITDYSAAMASAIIQREIGPDDHREMVDKFVNELDQTSLN